MTRTYTVTRVVLRSCILCGEPEWKADSHTQRELTYAEALTERNARCARCGGSLALEVDTRRVRLEAEIDWYADRPRRGRPPKALKAHKKGPPPVSPLVRQEGGPTHGPSTPAGATGLIGTDASLSRPTPRFRP